MDIHDVNKSQLAKFDNENREDEEISVLSKYQCSLCRSESGKLLLNGVYEDAAGKNHDAKSSEENQLPLYTVCEDIFGLSKPKSSHRNQQEQIFDAISKIKSTRPTSKVKLFSLVEICADICKLCDSMTTFLINLSKPPKLKSMLICCENMFDWLAKSDDNRILIYCHDSVSAIILMVYAYSCYYDALLRRDLRMSVAMKSFINHNAKHMESIPVSYRRYGSYMSLYSCMNQLQSLRASVYLYGIILYDFPSMESYKDKSSQLFFKIYTNDPLICCHTTKLYCLPASVNRLVILFDKIPISLANDTMVVCYHRSINVDRRTKLFRLNFHSCQAISDMLTFHCQDFEDVYPACSSKMKVEFHFRETAFFTQDSDRIIEAEPNELSHIERSDSYVFLDKDKPQSPMDTSMVMNNDDSKLVEMTKNSPQKDRKHSDSTSITIYKTSITDYRVQKAEDPPKSSINVINQSGRISGPIDSHHSTKLDTVRTSSTVLNGAGPSRYEYRTTNTVYGTNPQPLRVTASVDRDKCNQQLDNLMKDLNLENTGSRNVTRSSTNSYLQFNQTPSNQNWSSVNNNREIQLMTELLEAQKEISNLRRSMNHLDITDQPPRNVNNFNQNNFLSASRAKKITKGSVSSSTPDNYHFNKWSKLDNDHFPSIGTSPKPHVGGESIFNMETNSVSEFHDGRQTGYSAHRENMMRDKMIREKYGSMDQMVHRPHHNEKESTDVFEEIETINLQPIGKGIQDLAQSNGQTKMATGSTYKIDNTANFFSDNIGSLSPLSTRQNLFTNRLDTNSISRLHNDIGSPSLSHVSAYPSKANVTLQHVEDRIQYWYQPNISRDEAIALLRNSGPGHFLIRDSNTYSGAYGLAIKVATIPHNVTVKSDDIEAEKVRHYLIELAGNQGVCFKGFPEEPVFPSLAHLVLYYTHTSSVLPCLLSVPDKPFNSFDSAPRSHKLNTSHQSINISSPKISTNKRGNLSVCEFSVYYLGCYDVEHITGPSVINKSVERLMEYIDARRFTECQLRINPGEGIVLTDLERKLFFRRNHQFSSISYCATDPRDRKIELDLCKSKGIKKTKVFGIIVKSYIAGESKCFLFGELDPSQKSSTIVKIINDHLQKGVDNN